MVAVTSGKGGVGKTSIACNLAIALALRGARTTLVDLDMGLANADLLLNVRPRYTLAHALRGHRTLEEVRLDGPAGVALIPGSSGQDELANLSAIERRHLASWLERLRRGNDVVVLDCGAGISVNVVGFALVADVVLVVTTPQPTALADAYAMVKTLVRHRATGRVELFVNQATRRAQAEGAYDRLATVARRFLDYEVAYGGYMLQDTGVEEAVTHRSPFVLRSPESGASACIHALADGLMRSDGPVARRTALFRRIGDLFA
jgi:flagellar biosynthesis protein FlhG